MGVGVIVDKVKGDRVDDSVVGGVGVEKRDSVPCTGLPLGVPVPAPPLEDTVAVTVGTTVGRGVSEKYHWVSVGRASEKVAVRVKVVVGGRVPETVAQVVTLWDTVRWEEGEEEEEAVRVTPRLTRALPVPGRPPPPTGVSVG